MIETNEETLSVEQSIRNIKTNEANSFLGREQGSSQFAIGVHVVVNHARKKRQVGLFMNRF